MNKFGDAPIKGEGQEVWYSEYDRIAGYTPEEKEPTTWIEFSLPEAWEEECWNMIEKWLKNKRKEQAK